MFRQKFIVSNVILAILDQPKPKVFIVGQLWWPTPFFSKPLDLSLPASEH